MEMVGVAGWDPQLLGGVAAGRMEGGAAGPRDYFQEIFFIAGNNCSLTVFTLMTVTHRRSRGRQRCAVTMTRMNSIFSWEES